MTENAVAQPFTPATKNIFFRPRSAGDRTAVYRPSRYKVGYGGRGSSKSWGFADALLTLGRSRNIRALCVREFQTSIQDSVHQLLSDRIEALGFADDYEIQKTCIIGIRKKGTRFIFAGVKTDPKKIKSTEGVDVCWVEEAEAVSKKSWDVLIPTIRKARSEIWATFNPYLETDPTYRMFITSPPPNAIVSKVNWYDNPFFPETLKQEKDYLYTVDPEAAEHVWGGECVKKTDAQVLRNKFFIESFEPKNSWDGPYFGGDWGFATDPTTLVKCWIADNTLYIEKEVYGLGIETDDLPKFFNNIGEAAEHVIRADNARPENISYCNRHGYPRMVATEKWPGSVEDGIGKLRSFERIIIHPRCTHTAAEARLWSYKTDRLTGDVLPELIDKHNHCWDAIRYALQPIIRGHATAAGASVPAGQGKRQRIRA